MSLRRTEFDAELNRLHPQLMRSAVVLCWSSADVEDVVQETLLKAMRSSDTFKGQSSLLTWVYVIMTRVAAEMNRKSRRKLPSDYGSLQPDSLPPTVREVTVRETGRAIIDAIRALPTRQREMVTLHLLDELTYAEIAGAMNVAVGTVKATIFAAKSTLRTVLADTDVKQRTK